VIPATVALLGGGFILVALLLAGLPPLPSFLAKFAIIDALMHHKATIDAAAWMMAALMIVSGLVALIAMTRAGIELLWTPTDRPAVRLNLLEASSIGFLLAACIALMVGAAQTMVYMERTAQELSRPSSYVDAVRSKIATGGTLR
jgi:multicomponent K+:H+ antiporter subunit D